MEKSFNESDEVESITIPQDADFTIGDVVEMVFVENKLTPVLDD
jgi:uncharacterized protein (UPF0218 family)